RADGRTIESHETPWTLTAAGRTRREQRPLRRRAEPGVRGVVLQRPVTARSLTLSAVPTLRMSPYRDGDLPRASPRRASCPTTLPACSVNLRVLHNACKPCWKTPRWGRSL